MFTQEKAQMTFFFMGVGNLDWSVRALHHRFQVCGCDEIHLRCFEIEFSWSGQFA